jgi:hypothetical protein
MIASEGRFEPTHGAPLGDPGAAGAEIGVFDYLGGVANRDRLHHTLHWDGYGEGHKSDHQEIARPGLAEGFHTFALLWTAERYVFYVDGAETWRSAWRLAPRRVPYPERRGRRLGGRHRGSGAAGFPRRRLRPRVPARRDVREEFGE